MKTVQTEMVSIWGSAISSSPKPAQRHGLLHLAGAHGFWLLVVLITAPSPVWAKGTYLEPEQFLSQTFNGEVPKPQVIWLKPEQKQALADILQAPFRGLRQRYWKAGDTSAWILQHIGKEQPITAGFVIKQGKLQSVHVLVFRESRGWEIKHDFFTRQFDHAHLESDYDLSNTIDGISGATLSVRAMKNMARFALYLEPFTTP